MIALLNLQRKYNFRSLSTILPPANESYSLFVGNDVNTWVVKGGGLGKEGRDDCHGGRDGLRVTKRCPKTHHGVRRPGNQEHDDHYDGHL